MKHDFWILADTFNKTYNKRMKSVMNNFHVSAAEIEVLLFLACSPSLDTASDIVRAKKMQKSHVSLAVKELAEKEMITLHPDTANHKRIHLSVTSKAADVIHAGFQVQKEFIEQLFTDFTEEEKKLIVQFAERVEKNIILLDKNDV